VLSYFAANLESNSKENIMRRFVFAILALAFVLPLTAQAQQWNAEQQEVWDAVDACWDAPEVETYMACIHDDFVSWGTGSGVPANKTDVRPSVVRRFEIYEDVWSYMKPVSIDVRGDMAIVLYVSTYVQREKATGEETTTTTNWTEVFERNGNRWQLIVDHGTVVEPN
jgi:hypothetical protein